MDTAPHISRRVGALLATAFALYEVLLFVHNDTELKRTTKKSYNMIRLSLLVHTVSMFSGYMGPRASNNSFTVRDLLSQVQTCKRLPTLLHAFTQEEQTERNSDEY